MLLAHMLQNSEIARFVEKEIGSQFYIEAHNALAAYLYAFYAEEHEANPQKFITSLDGQELVQLAAQLMTLNVNPQPSEKALQDYIRQINSFPLKLQIDEMIIKQKQAESEGDVLQAALIASEIVQLKQRLHMYQ
jgi:DNA primase